VAVGWNHDPGLTELISLKRASRPDTDSLRHRHEWSGPVDRHDNRLDRRPDKARTFASPIIREALIDPRAGF
jgi:hypothetical protein